MWTSQNIQYTGFARYVVKQTGTTNCHCSCTTVETNTKMSSSKNVGAWPENYSEGPHSRRELTQKPSRSISQELSGNTNLGSLLQQGPTGICEEITAAAHSSRLHWLASGHRTTTRLARLHRATTPFDRTVVEITSGLALRSISKKPGS